LKSIGLGMGHGCMSHYLTRLWW